MNELSIIGVLVWRNLTAFVRNRSSLLFAILPPLVMCLFYLTLMRQQVGRAMTGLVPTGQPDSGYLGCDSWLFGSAALLAGCTASAGVLLGLIDDRYHNRLSTWLATVKRWQIIAGYLVSSAAAAFASTMAFIFVGQFWNWVSARPAMGLGGWLAAILGAVLAAIFFTGLNALALALSGSLTTIRTIYIPLWIAVAFLSFSLTLPADGGLSKVLGLLPFAQAGALVRDPLVTPFLATSDLPLYGVDYLLATGIQIGNGTVWPGWFTALVLLLWSAALIALSTWNLDRQLATK